jgi:hypothetical protein
MVPPGRRAFYRGLGVMRMIVVEMEEPRFPRYRIRFNATEDGREPVREWLNDMPRDVKKWVGFMLRAQLQEWG